MEIRCHPGRLTLMERASGVDGVTQDHHLLDVLEAGVEVTAGDVATGIG